MWANHRGTGRGGPLIPRWDRPSPGTGGPQIVHEDLAVTSTASNQANDTQRSLLVGHLPPARRRRLPPERRN